jgi:hypothetical protein
MSATVGGTCSAKRARNCSSGKEPCGRHREACSQKSRSRRTALEPLRLTTTLTAPTDVVAQLSFDPTIRAARAEVGLGDNVDKRLKARETTNRLDHLTADRRVAHWACVREAHDEGRLATLEPDREPPPGLGCSAGDLVRSKDVAEEHVTLEVEEVQPHVARHDRLLFWNGVDRYVRSAIECNSSRRN